MSEDHDVLKRALVHATAYLDRLDTSPVAPQASREDLLKALGHPLADHGEPATDVIDALVRDVRGGITGSQGGRFFAWVIGGGLPAAIAADWMTTVWDQNAGIYACSPAASVVEEIVGEWLKELFGLPMESSVAFVTGAQMAHATCLAAARNALLAKRGWDVETQGLCGAPRIRILATAERHGTIDRAARLIGLGSACVEPVAIDKAGSADPERLAHMLSSSDAPTIVALQAGELNTGAFDDFRSLAPIAHAAHAWVHVDGAFGLWARVSPRHAALADGVELCDSWTTDGHKALNVPYDSGFAIIRDARAHRAAMTTSTSYLPPGDGARDSIDWNPEFSRRARGFATYAAIRQLGRAGLAGMIERTCDHVAALTARIAALPGVKVVVAPRFNQALVSFGDRTDAVIAAINASGEAMFGGVTYHGARAMRISLVNWRTTDTDLDRIVTAVAQALETDR